jgi:hypothetical protein
MDRVRVEQHQGKRIVVVDGTDVATEQYADVLRAGAALVIKEPLGSVRLATVVTRAHFGGGAGERIKAYSAAIKPHVLASAVVGLSTLQRVLFVSLKPFMHGTVRDFPTLEEARAWLVSFPDP